MSATLRSCRSGSDATPPPADDHEETLRRRVEADPGHLLAASGWLREADPGGPVGGDAVPARSVPGRYVGNRTDEVDGAQPPGRVDHPHGVARQVEDGVLRRDADDGRDPGVVVEPRHHDVVGRPAVEDDHPGIGPEIGPETLDVGAVVLVVGVWRDHGRRDRRGGEIAQGHCRRKSPIVAVTAPASPQGTGLRTSPHAPPGRGRPRVRARCPRSSAGSVPTPHRSPDRSDRRRAGRRPPGCRPTAAASPRQPSGNGTT